MGFVEGRWLDVTRSVWFDKVRGGTRRLGVAQQQCWEVICSGGGSMVMADSLGQAGAGWSVEIENLNIHRG